MDPVLAGAAGTAAATTAVVGALAWHKWMGDRKLRKEEIDRLLAQEQAIAELKKLGIPEGSIYVCSDGTRQRIHASLIGGFFVVAVGTYGLNQVRKLLILLDQCGLDRLVGVVLVLENDAQLRNKFLTAVPSIFNDRIVYGYSDSFSGGLVNREAEYASRKIRTWGPGIVAATLEAIDRYLRLNNSRSPSLILWFQSLGGQTKEGVPGLRRIHERFEETLIVGFVSLHRHDDLRYNFPKVKPELEAHGVHVWMLSDDLASDPVAADYGMIAAPVALTDAALHGDSTQANNAFVLAASRDPGSILSYSVWASYVVGTAWQPDPNEPPKYYVMKMPVVERITKGLEVIAAGGGVSSADLPIIDRSRSTFDIVLTAVYHEDLQKIQDHVTMGREIEYETLAESGGDHRPPGELFRQENYETAFASMAAVIDPNRPACPVIVVRLAVVPYGDLLIDEVVKPPAKRAFNTARQLLENSNGHRKDGRNASRRRALQTPKEK